MDLLFCKGKGGNPNSRPLIISFSRLLPSFSTTCPPSLELGAPHCLGRGLWGPFSVSSLGEKLLHTPLAMCMTLDTELIPPDRKPSPLRRLRIPLRQRAASRSLKATCGELSFPFPAFPSHWHLCGQARPRTPLQPRGAGPPHCPRANECPQGPLSPSGPGHVPHLHLESSRWRHHPLLMPQTPLI